MDRIDRALSKLGILDNLSGRVLDLFQIAVQEAFEMTHLPEMLEVLGREKFIALLNVFEDTKRFSCPHCGHEVKWPPLDEFTKILHEIEIYTKLSATAKGSKSKVVRELAREYNTTPGKIRAANDRMVRRMKRYSIKSSKSKS
jgi:hypothetical protein